MSLNTNSDASAAALLETMRPPLADLPDGAIAVALSGGGDSVALTQLLKIWCAETGRRLEAVTVDHGLRPESAKEAENAANMCRNIGVQHTMLAWQGWDQTGNLQDAARKARRQLIGDWARSQDITAVALGHTLNDLAETFLMRLARGSGVDGLAAMGSRFTDHDILWVRPMLEIGRETLRDFLRGKGITWSEDPSNEDPRFDRVRARAVLESLDPLGLSRERLAKTAMQMSRARTALERATLDLARHAASPGRLGDVTLNPARMASAPEEIRLRLLASTLQWVAAAPYRPRLSALTSLNNSVGPGGLDAATTLHGCILRDVGDTISVRREPGRQEGLVQANLLWDGRWKIPGGSKIEPDFQIGALGEAGLAQWENWHDSGIDREILITSPAIWNNGRLIASLARDSAANCPLCLKGGSNGFFDAICTR